MTFENDYTNDILNEMRYPNTVTGIPKTFEELKEYTTRVKEKERNRVREAIIKLRQKMADISFICKDKEIHFGALHVVYVRDAMNEVENTLKDLGIAEK
jgi:hypothetical protein